MEFKSSLSDAKKRCIQCKPYLYREFTMGMPPKEFPGTEDELKESCYLLENIKSCLMERLNDCDSNNYDDLEVARSDLRE
ncbi:hypothetical protein CEXT_520211 [Caerostris extrusa]|uniref:Uncharacterized protein n=1 Tax=Caerostris extrusa TaxID=172846 RepID=A0AAV4QUR1_CAEEX|nr:hypothetical protein CEXT_520211 [Caerostris extrusa]